VIILTDVDGVLADLSSAFCRWLARTYDVHRTPDDHTTWHFHEAFGIPKEHEDEYFAEVRRGVPHCEQNGPGEPAAGSSLG
jgi:FMN phosphatase YigB (HAD superfamily)